MNNNTLLNEYITKKYIRYNSPDPILLLSDGLKPKYIPDFYIDNDSALNLSNYNSKGIENSLLYIFLLIIVIGILLNFLLSYT